MKKNVLIIAGLLFAIALQAQKHYTADPNHSSINFKIKHLGISYVNGSFTKFDGSLMGDVNKPEQTKIDFSVDVNSIDTRIKMRDDHLRSADFFEVEKFPQMTFKSSKVEKQNNEKFLLNGMLTIKGVTRNVTFDVVYGGSAKDDKGNEILGFTATTTINRLDYNISYDPQTMVLSKDVKIILYLEFKSN